MKQSNDELNRFYAQVSKWVCRGTFLIIAGMMTYVATRESYNFSHWVPHPLLKNMGVPYAVVLWSEQNADIFLHFFGALFITLLIFGAQFWFFKTRPLAIFIFVSFLCAGAELFQYLIARGFESNDLLLGILGSFMAYSAIKKKNQNRTQTPSQY
jgi:hypothetical protein